MPSEFTTSPAEAREQKYPWRVFWFLLIAALAGAAAAVPLVLEIFQPLIQNAPRPSISPPLIIVLGIAQNSVLLGVLIGVGLVLARKFDMGAPLLESWLYDKKPRVSAGDSLKQGVLVGIAVGIVLLVTLLIAAPYFPGLPFVSAAHAALWKRVLVCFYGGIDEEILTRLFLLTLIAWVGARFQKQKARLSPATFWFANVIVAILFGLGHLPNASMVMHITPTVVVLALLLNGVAAISFGYLYWKRGLESAIAAHFCADFVIYVIGPAFLKTGLR
jgi:membrane protease YdiL (CAAX protease family)